MGRGSVVVVSMPERGHVNRLLPVVRGLSDRGLAVHVLTDARFADGVVRHGGRFVDLFGRFPIEGADDASLPIPSRYVSFAAVYFDALLELVSALEPELIVYDTFAVVAPLLGRRLGIPYVNCCSGHAATPEKMIPAMRANPRVRTSPQCEAAVRILREVHGLEDASPFSFFDAVSPFLNLYCEPPPFLGEADRAVFEPIAFMGSLAPEDRDAASVAAEPVFRSPPGRRRVYVSFGTVIWRYFEEVATAALEVLAEALGDSGAETCISLGGHEADDLARKLRSRPGVRVERYVDQWSVLREADLFVTHHGLNSTHESIYHEVPMISYPFFGDQPDQARRCRDLGLAVPLVAQTQARFRPEAVTRALARIDGTRSDTAKRLAEARGWELETIAGRPAAIDRMLGLMAREGRRPPPES